MTGPTRAQVEVELERLLASPALRGSKRSQEFLHHVVEAALAGESDRLKERTIGIALFQRKSDYDTSEDAIVRVKANEVRRRLVQAYQEVGPGREVEIHLPTGSYVPEFRMVVAGVSGEVTGSSSKLRTGRTGWTWWYWAAGVVVLGVVAGWLMWSSREAGPFERFWAPFLRAEGKVLVCVPNPAVYALTAAAREGTAAVARDQIRMNATDYIGVGDLMAASRLAAHFAVRGKPYQIRPGNDTSFAEIRSAPAVFVGAFTNQWTMEVSQGWRFTFHKEGGVNSIQDASGKTRGWVMGGAGRDYAVMTRVFASRTGQAIIVAAGLGHYGTQAAGEFLTSQAAMDGLLEGLEAGWERKNLQVVIEVEVIGKAPGPPKVVATQVW